VTQVTDTDLTQLLREEIELAKQEARLEGRKVAVASSMYGGAFFAAVLAAILLSFALVYALGVIMPLAWGAVIVGIIWIFLGMVLSTEARRRFRTADPRRRELSE